MVSVLQSVIRYEIQSCIICCVLLVLGVIGILWAVWIRKGKKTPVISKVIACAVILIFMVVGVAYIAQVKTQNGKIQNDISNAQYVTYEGTFVHDDYQKDSFYHNVYIVNKLGETVLLRLPDYANMYGTHTDYQELPVGEGIGKLIYSKESKLILRWQ